jgi:hypothetical protein
MNKPAAATTGGQGLLLYSEDIDLNNLGVQEVGNKVDIWATDIRKHKTIKMKHLVDGFDPNDFSSKKLHTFNFLASYITRKENNLEETVKFSRKGSVKEIITKRNTYRCKGYEIHTKRKKEKKK